MAFRKRKGEDVPLDKIIGAYQATSLPTGTPAPAIASIRCWQCKKPNLYDTRRAAPRRCTWCRSVLA